MNKKVSTQAIGASAEKQALHYLQSQGLTLITQNFSCKHGEIDLIMQTADSLSPEIMVFVEVRFRKLLQYGHGIETVSDTKKQKLRRTALFYLQENNLLEKIPCRFDVVGASENEPLVWIKNAFEVHY